MLMQGVKWQMVSSPVSPMWHCKLIRGWEVCRLVNGPTESPEGISPRVTVVSLVGYHQIAGASGQGWTCRFPLGCQCGMGPDVDGAQCKVLLLRALRCSVQCRLCWLITVWAVVAEHLRIGPDSQCCPSSSGPMGGRAIIMVNISQKSQLKQAFNIQVLIRFF